MNKAMNALGFNLMSLWFKLRDLRTPPKSILSEAGIEPGFRVLDYGCGPGSFAIAAAQLVGPSGKVYAADVNLLAVRRVRDAALSAGLDNVRTIHTDCATGLESNSLDLALLYDTYHALAEPDETLAELHRALKPGATLSFSDHHMQKDAILSAVTRGGLFELSSKGKKTYSFLKLETRSASGAPILRHKESQNSIAPPVEYDAQAAEQIQAHIERHIGQTSTVYHELISNLVHIDIHIIEPTEEQNFYTLVTSGMSDQPMNAPQEFEQFKYAELLLCLPPAWPLSQQDFEHEENYWPVRWLKILARMPHEHDTWLWLTHTIPNGDPPEPYAANTDLCCTLLARPVLFGDEFLELEISADKTVHFLCLLPIYKQEMDLKLERGARELLAQLDKLGVTELLDLHRRNTCL